MWKIVKRFLYSKKITGQKKVTRILFFRFKKTIKPKFPFTPNIKNIGKCTYTGGDIEIANPNTSIGKFCSIGPRCILGHGIHPVNFLTTSPYLYFDKLKYKHEEMESHDEYWEMDPIVIGNDVWIGDGVFVKNGVTIHDGAIIGARSMVTKDVPAYAIVVGSPATILRYRFDEETIRNLLDLKWWDLPDDIIKSIPYSNIQESINFLKSKKENI